jgi:hypothetical protein
MKKIIVSIIFIILSLSSCEVWTPEETPEEHTGPVMIRIFNFSGHTVDGVRVGDTVYASMAHSTYADFQAVPSGDVYPYELKSGLWSPASEYSIGEAVPGEKYMIYITPSCYFMWNESF